MWETPINVYGRRGSGEAVARRVAAALPGSEITGTGERLTVSAAGGVTINVEGDHFQGIDGRRQAAGMAGFFADTFRGPRSHELLGMVKDLRLALAFMAEPSIDPSRGEELFRLATAIARETDGFVLSMDEGCVWDGNGEVLASTETDEDDDDVADPPTIERVRQRLVVLVGLAFHGLSAGEAQQDVLEWVAGAEVDDELEPEEREFLLTSSADLVDADVTNATWRIEGAAVLAWALELLELPPHDVQVDPDHLGRALGWPDPTLTTAIVVATRLRPREQLDGLAEHLFAVHWRLREFGLHRQGMDFAEFARTAWFGPLDITGARLVDDDLAIGDLPISQTDPNDVALAASTVMERHLAANWLRDGGVYSGSDVST